MCHFISAVLPSVALEEEIRLIACQSQLNLKLINNQHVASQLQPGEQHYLTTRKYCDCGTPLGSSVRESSDYESTEDNSFRGVEKLRKKGWSEAKIQRWIEQKVHIEERDERVQQQHDELRTPETEIWIQFLNFVLDQKLTPWIGLLLHLYSGSIEGERIKLVDRQVSRIQQVTPDYLLQIREDVLYQFNA